MRRKFCEEDLLKDDFQAYMASESDRGSMDEDGPDVEMIRERYKAKFGKFEDTSESDSDSESDNPHVPLAPVGSAILTDSDLVEVSDEDSLSGSEEKKETSGDNATDGYTYGMVDEPSLDASMGGSNDHLVPEPENEVMFEFAPEKESRSSSKSSKPKRGEKSLTDPKKAAELQLLLLDDNSLKAARTGLRKELSDQKGGKLTRKERSRLTKLEKKMKQQGSDDEQVEEDGFQVRNFCLLVLNVDFCARITPVN